MQIWPEKTDPQKFVYEDVAIATYLLVSLKKFNMHIFSILNDQIVVGVTSLWYNLQSQITWEIQRREEKSVKLQSFVDLGCGNGLLVHILQSEGVRFFKSNFSKFETRLF